MIGSITLDTGAMIALERRSQRMTAVVAAARSTRTSIFVPQVVLAEWWRGRTDVRERMLAIATVDPMTDAVAKLAGEALAAVEHATTIDAIVMASAARRAGSVFTGDRDDLERLRAYFPAVRVLGA